VWNELAIALDCSFPFRLRVLNIPRISNIERHSSLTNIIHYSYCFYRDLEVRRNYTAVNVVRIYMTLHYKDTNETARQTANLNSTVVNVETDYICIAWKR